MLFPKKKQLQGYVSVVLAVRELTVYKHNRRDELTCVGLLAFSCSLKSWTYKSMWFFGFETEHSFCMPVSAPESWIRPCSPWFFFARPSNSNMTTYKPTQLCPLHSKSIPLTTV